LFNPPASLSSSGDFEIGSNQRMPTAAEHRAHVHAFIEMVFDDEEKILVDAAARAAAAAAAKIVPFVPPPAQR
jgi:hypothetical protein